MTYTPVEGHIIPEAVMNRFRDVPLDEQLPHFRLYSCSCQTCSITNSDDRFNPAQYSDYAG